MEINFNFNNSVLVQNHIKIDDEHSETLVTEFWFSSKSIFVTPLCSNETGTNYNNTKGSYKSLWITLFSILKNVFIIERALFLLYWLPLLYWQANKVRGDPFKTSTCLGGRGVPIANVCRCYGGRGFRVAVKVAIFIQLLSFILESI